jgi:hypothetical protein
LKRETNIIKHLPFQSANIYHVLLLAITHRSMNIIRSRFFWRVAGDDFNYHMVRWEAICRPKEFGGLEIINTQVFNECLLTKWIWKLYKQKNSLWVKLLTAKYMRHGNFFKTREGQGSILKKPPQGEAPLQIGGCTQSGRWTTNTILE